MSYGTSAVQSAAPTHRSSSTSCASANIFYLLSSVRRAHETSSRKPIVERKIDNNLAPLMADALRTRNMTSGANGTPKVHVRFRNSTKTILDVYAANRQRSAQDNNLTRPAHPGFRGTFSLTYSFVACPAVVVGAGDLRIPGACILPFVLRGR